MGWIWPRSDGDGYDDDDDDYGDGGDGTMIMMVVICNIHGSSPKILTILGGIWDKSVSFLPWLREKWFSSQREMCFLLLDFLCSAQKSELYWSQLTNIDGDIIPWLVS